LGDGGGLVDVQAPALKMPGSWRFIWQSEGRHAFFSTHPRNASNLHFNPDNEIKSYEAA
jgi:hypothetical protein